MTFLLSLKLWLGVFPAFLLLFSQVLLTSIVTDPHFFFTFHLSYFASFSFFFPTENMEDTSALGCNSSPAVCGFLQTAGQVHEMGQHMGCCVYSSIFGLGPLRLLGLALMFWWSITFGGTGPWHGGSMEWGTADEHKKVRKGRAQSALRAFPWPKPNPLWLSIVWRMSQMSHQGAQHTASHLHTGQAKKHGTTLYRYLYSYLTITMLCNYR